MRLDLVARELACERLDLALFRRELEVHRGSVARPQLLTCRYFGSASSL